MVTLTEKAIAEVKRIMETENLKDNYLRIGVRGSGCSGFQWILNLDEVYNEKKDVLEEHQGINIVVDNRSAMYVDGTIVDYYDDGLLKRGFTFSNPAIKSTCGCGSSFSV